MDESPWPWIHEWDSGPRLAVFLIALPDPLPVAHGSVWSRVVDEVEPTLENVAQQSMPDFPLMDSSGHNFVSLRLWQVKEPSVAAFTPNMIAIQKVTAALLDRTDMPEMPASPDEGYRTVVEAVTYVSSPEALQETEDKPDPLTRCVNVLIDQFRAYRLSTGTLVRELSYERLHPSVFWLTRTPERGSQLTTMGMMILSNRAHLKGLSPPLLGEHDEAGMAQYLSRLVLHDPLVLYAERRLDAKRLLWAEGQYAESCVQTAIASEILLDAILGFMIWEECDTGIISDADAVLVFSTDLMPRVKNQYQQRLKGVWRLDRGVVREWDEHIAIIRNRVVHGGFRATQSAAVKARETLISLQTHIGNRIADRWRKYPRTAWAFLGSDGLDRRGKLDSAGRWREAAVGDREDWIAEYVSWRAGINTQLERRRHASPAHEPPRGSTARDS